MTKGELIVAVSNMLFKSAKIMEECGIKVENYKQDFEKRHVPELREGYHWLKLRMPLIESYVSVQRLLPPEIWESYKFMDCEEFREVVMLADAAKKIKKGFTGRPIVFRKVKDASKCKAKKEQD